MPPASLSLRARLARAVAFQMRAHAERHQDDIPRLRQDFDKLGRLLPKPFGVQVRRERVAGVAVEVLTPKAPRTDVALMYLHGGGYVIGSPLSHRAFTMTLARALGVEVWVPDYALAPENPFPAALGDARQVWERFAEKFAGRTLWLAGESAGGGLSASLAQSLRGDGARMPDRLWLISPWLDVSLSGENCQRLDSLDAVLGYGFTQQVFANNYCQPSERQLAAASPLFGELAGLPPCYVQVGEHEILLDDSLRFADKARAAGVDVTLEVASGMWHAWVLFAAVAPEAKASLRSALAWLRAGRS